MADHGLTAAQRRRLAREMRKLAMECVEGGPEMEAGDWCGCAIGISLRRAGIAARPVLAFDVDGMLTDDGDPGKLGLVSIATDLRCEGEPTAVVFPLLALADAVESTPAIEAADV